MIIPYGTRYSRTAHGSKTKGVVCENCSTLYVYRLERSSTGSGSSLLWSDNAGAKSRADLQAIENLSMELTLGIDPVACPTCGWLQKPMRSLLKRRKLEFVLRIVVPVTLVLVAWGLMREYDAMSVPIVLCGLSIGCIGLTTGLLRMVLHDPNREHPGRGGTDPKRMAETRGVAKADLDAIMPRDDEGPKQIFQRLLLTTTRHVAAIVGAIVARDENAIGDMYRQTTGAKLSPEHNEPNYGVDGVDDRALLFMLSTYGSVLTDEAKDYLISAAVDVASVDGTVHNNAGIFITRLAMALRVRKERFHALILRMER